jgi:hypothetical protein
MTRAAFSGGSKKPTCQCRGIGAFADLCARLINGLSGERGFGTSECIWLCPDLSGCRSRSDGLWANDRLIFCDLEQFSFHSHTCASSKRHGSVPRYSSS